ncbi:MAG: tetratricopeptide repeat protein [Bacteroidota bacterium]|nr:tetratricopeptide repeat protein [Bacteroidota bacterium]
MLHIKYQFLTLIFLTLFLSCKNNDQVKQQPAYTNSKDVLKNLIKQYPDSLMLVQNLIEAYRNDASYDSALALTDAEIKKDSGNAYLWNMKATLQFENDDTLNAIRSLEHAVNIYPLPEYLIALGTIYAEVKNTKALIIADGLLRANKIKNGKDAYFLKGLYYNYAGDKNKAINYFDSSLQLDFTYMYAYREKGIALFDLGKYDAALETLKRAVTIQNNFEEGYYWMGKCYEKLDMKNDAIQSYENALLYDKNFTEAKEALDRLKGNVQ